MKSKEDVITACYEGADAVGFIVGTTHKTEDAVSVAEVKNLKRWVAPFVTPVLVTHFTFPEAIVALALELQIKTLQLQGDILPEDIIAIRKKIPEAIIIKAIHVTNHSAIKQAEQYSCVADVLLLDSKTSDRIGGTGLTHDWNISAEIVKRVNIPVILAGGLTPENVVDAIKKVNPYGVDVNTGTKGSNGYKDPEKVRAFIRNAKSIVNRCYAY